MAGGWQEPERWDERADDLAETKALPPGRVAQPPRRRPVVDAARLWSAGVATAVVAALTGFVGVLVVRALLQIPYLAPLDSGAIGDSSKTILLCVLAAVAALGATGLVHLLLLGTPQPLAYFGWITGLLTAVAAVVPLLGTGSLAVRLATGIIHLIIGLSIISLVTGAAMSSSNRG